MSEDEDAAAIGRKLLAAKKFILDHKVPAAIVIAVIVGAVIVWLL